MANTSAELLIEQVVATTAYHVENSADPAAHRTEEHIEQVLRPHLERIQQLLDDGQDGLLEFEIQRLRNSQAMVATSLSLIVREMRLTGLKGCLAVFLGEKDFTSDIS